MTQGERVRYLRQDKHLTLEKFGERIGLKKNSLSQIENGRNSLTESVIKSICREYRVDYLWLTQGVGEMYIQEDSRIKLYRLIDRVLDGENEHVKNVFKNFSELNAEDFDELTRIMDQLLDEKEPE